MRKLIYEVLRKCKRTIKAPYILLLTLVSKKRKKAILKAKREKQRSRIKVGFVAQMPEVWDKEAPLFEGLLKDKRFEVSLIILPHYDFSESKLGHYGEEKVFFIEKYPAVNIVYLKNENDTVINDSYDYIFYQRCYEQYLPKQFRCKKVIRHSITCYIPYCYHATAEPTVYYQTSFFRYLGKFYCCSNDQYRQVKKINGVECQYLGCPVIDSLDYVSKPHNSVNVLWTPRWTDDPTVGGTSFNRNRNRILDIIDIDERVKLILRPHPLTFENAVKQGWMTTSDIEDYKRSVVEKGASFDGHNIIEETFFDTDILITDFTSAIITFYLSGRPIIYCTESNFPMVGYFKDIFETLYIARDWEDIKTVFVQLLDGFDPLYEKRQEIIKKIKSEESSVKRIINDLVDTISS